MHLPKKELSSLCSLKFIEKRKEQKDGGGETLENLMRTFVLDSFKKDYVFKKNINKCIIMVG